MKAREQTPTRDNKISFDRAFLLGDSFPVLLRCYFTAHQLVHRKMAQMTMTAHNRRVGEERPKHFVTGSVFQ